MINQFRTELKYGELAQLVLNGIAFPVHGKNVARVRRWQVVCTRTAECWVGRVIKRNNNCRGFQFPEFSECSLRSFVSSWEKDGAFITRGHRRRYRREGERLRRWFVQQRMDEDGRGRGVWSLLVGRAKEGGEAPSPLCRHSSPLTFTSSTSDGGQILIQLGRINQITMAPPLPSPLLLRLVTESPGIVPISIEHTLSWNNRRRSSRGGEWL